MKTPLNPKLQEGKDLLKDEFITLSEIRANGWDFRKIRGSFTNGKDEYDFVHQAEGVRVRLPGWVVEAMAVAYDAGAEDAKAKIRECLGMPA